MSLDGLSFVLYGLGGIAATAVASYIGWQNNKKPDGTLEPFNKDLFLNSCIAGFIGGAAYYFTGDTNTISAVVGTTGAAVYFERIIKLFPSKVQPSVPAQAPAAGAK